ncbi:MAG: hypothetical protein RIR49_266 [Actinomycetota bacterium]|jgi:hypothetical protein
MGDLHEVHRLIGWVMIGGNGLVGAWLTGAQYLPVLRRRPMWVAVVLAQLVVGAQAIVGALLATRPGVPLDDMHALYGFSAVIAVGILYSYRSSPFIRDKQYLLYGIGSLFVMGLGLRNLVLGV